MTVEQALQLAIGHYEATHFAETESICRQILAVMPSNVDALHLLGLVAHRVGRNDIAVQLLNQVVARSPGRTDVLNNLGEVYRAMARPDEAIAAYTAALAGDPNLREAHNNLGIVLALTGRHSEAIASWQRAIALKPNDGSSYNNLGNLLQTQGRIDEAVAAHRRAVELTPNNPWHNSNLLRDLTYSETITPQELLQEHRLWWQRHGQPHAANIAPHTNDRDPDRRLRIGLLSPDFRTHSVAYFLEPILAAHERASFEFICYAELAHPDATSQRLQQQSEGWRSTAGVADAALAQQIRADAIDILIDLAGHTASTRIAVCAHKPAPVQMSYLGYPFSTGLETIDYRITDAHADPPGSSEQFYVERLLRLPQTAWCYRPPEPTPQVSESPSTRHGFVTFGSFNNLAKLSHGVLDTWSRVLEAVPHSRLILKSAGIGDPMTQTRVLESFAAHGVGADRLLLKEYENSLFDHFARYNDIDIALDSFPYNGTTTTCEAMWMGVPVIGLAGEIHLSRVGVSLLSNVGLAELVAASRDDYVRVASELAGDTTRLRTLRSELRPRMAVSPLRDESGFTRAFEAALRNAWHQWCDATTTAKP